MYFTFLKLHLFIFNSEETVLQKILKHLTEIKEENKNLRKDFKKLQEKIERKIAAPENAQVAAALNCITEISDDFNCLPLTYMENLQNLEEEIARDASKATSLARFLCKGVAFANSNALTLAVIKRLMSREMALKYSLEGRQDKLKITDLNLFNVVIASVKMRYEDADITGIAKRIGKVLSGASDWDGNRERRKRKRISVDNENLTNV